MRRWTALIVALAVAAFVGGIARAEGTLEALQKDLENVVAKVSPAVVTVELPGGRLVVGQGAPATTVRLSDLISGREGSGVAVGTEGYIVTSAEGFSKTTGTATEGLDVNVRTADGKRLAAKLVASDPRSGLAVLKLTEGTLPGLEIAGGKVGVGTLVVVVGNTFGMERSVSLALVSGTGRTIVGGGGEGWWRQFSDMIQLNVPVKPGEAGGLVADTSGRVAGILHSGYRQPGSPQVFVMGSANGRNYWGPQGGEENLGFAVSGRVVQKVIDDVKRDGKVTWGYIGLSFHPVEGQGLQVTGVEDKGPAATGGVAFGDVIRGYRVKREDLEGKEARLIFKGERDDSAKLVDAVSFARPGTKVALEVARMGKDMDLEVVVGTAPEEKPPQQQVVTPFEFRGGAAGGAVMNVQQGPWVGAFFAKTPEGVKVLKVVDDSPAAKAGLKEGDLVIEIDGKAVKEPAEVQKTITEHKTGDKLNLKVERGDAEVVVGVTLADRPAPELKGYVVEGPGGQIRVEANPAPTVRPGASMPEQGNVDQQRKIEKLQKEVDELKKQVEELQKAVVREQMDNKPEK